MQSGDRKWALGWMALVMLIAARASPLVLKPWHRAAGVLGC